MKETDPGIKYDDVIVLTSGNTFFQGNAVIHSNGDIDLALIFNEGCTYKTGDKIRICDILVNSSGKEINSKTDDNDAEL